MYLARGRAPRDTIQCEREGILAARATTVDRDSHGNEAGLLGRGNSTFAPPSIECCVEPGRTGVRRDFGRTIPSALQVRRQVDIEGGANVDRLGLRALKLTHDDVENDSVSLA